jgi:lipoprotein-releasing system ATP-binding protein
MSEPILIAQGVAKVFSGGGLEVPVLSGVDLVVQPGETVAIIGASGSGKSTLLHLLGGLDTPSAGRVTLMGRDFSNLGEVDRGDWRNRHLGFVYQFHHLLAEFSALENVAMPLLIRRTERQAAMDKAAEILTAVGLGHRLEHRPGELSGNLDSHTASVVFGLLIERVREQQASLIVVTHDEKLASKADRVFQLHDGVLRN